MPSTPGPNPPARRPSTRRRPTARRATWRRMPACRASTWPSARTSSPAAPAPPSRPPTSPAGSRAGSAWASRPPPPPPASAVTDPQLRDGGHRLSLVDRLLGRPLSSAQAEEEKIGVWAGIPILGLDGLSSSAYGPEAALTLLVPLGAAGLAWIGPLTLVILGLLLLLYLSYRQTIGAYPQGGGSYTVAKENLGTRVGLLAAASLMIDYILNVAVGISAGVAALVSAVPALQPRTLLLCLAILAVITVVNLRGMREPGLAFGLPTYLFIASLGLVVAAGVV